MFRCRIAWPLSYCCALGKTFSMKMLARRGSAGFLRSSKHSRRRHRLALRLTRSSRYHLWFSLSLGASWALLESKRWLVRRYLAPPQVADLYVLLRSGDG